MADISFAYNNAEASRPTVVSIRFSDANTSAGNSSTPSTSNDGRDAVAGAAQRRAISRDISVIPAIISAYSEHYRSLFARWSGENRELAVVDVKDAEEADLLELLFKYCYAAGKFQDTFIAESSLDKLLKLLLLAHQATFLTCVETLCTILTSRVASLEDARIVVCWIPEGLVEQCAIIKGSLYHHCRGLIVSACENLEKVFKDAMYKDLPLDIIKAILTNPRASIVSENTAFCLAWHWARHAMPPCSPVKALVDKLADALLFNQMSACFLEHISKPAYWDGTEAQKAAATALSHKLLTKYGRETVFALASVGSNRVLPVHFVRPGTRGPVVRTWKFWSTEHVVRSLAVDCFLEYSEIYCGGYYFKFAIGRTRTSDSLVIRVICQHGCKAEEFELGKVALCVFCGQHPNQLSPVFQGYVTLCSSNIATLPISGRGFSWDNPASAPETFVQGKLNLTIEVEFFGL